MMNKICFILLISMAFVSGISAQKITPEQYVAEYKKLAVSEMKRAGVPASITLAQGILETESGNSDLLSRSNNHFGIKCKSSWTGDSVKHDDDAKGECFRAYSCAADSYRDHSDFLKSNTRYSSLFQLDPSDYRGWAYGLKKAGYATNPRYPDILIKNIEMYNLQQYDQDNGYEITVSAVVENFTPPATKIIPAEVEEKTLLNQPIFDDNSSSTINGVKALLAAKGTSLLAIASQNHLKLGRLLEMNELKKDGLLEKDAIIFLEKKKKEGNRNFTESSSGETLYDVSQRNGILLLSLCEYNRLTADDAISAGTRLFLKPQQTVMQDNVSPSINSLNENNLNLRQSENEKVHEVQAREGLYSISKKYGVSVSQIKDWNNLKDDQLQTGKVLIISK